MRAELENLVRAADLARRGMYIESIAIRNAIGEDLHGAIAAARDALTAPPETTEGLPYTVLYSELCDGDLIAFDVTQFEILETVEDLERVSRYSTAHVTWELVSQPDPYGPPMFRQVALEADRTYVVMRSVERATVPSCTCVADVEGPGMYVDMADVRAALAASGEVPEC